MPISDLCGHHMHLAHLHGCSEDTSITNLSGIKNIQSCYFQSKHAFSVPTAFHFQPVLLSMLSTFTGISVLRPFTRDPVIHLLKILWLRPWPALISWLSSHSPFQLLRWGAGSASDPPLQLCLQYCVSLPVYTLHLGLPRTQGLSALLSLLQELLS